MSDKERNPPPDRDDVEAAAEAIVESVLENWRHVDEALGPDFRNRLLAGFDDHRRRRRRKPSLSLFADALGWRALARPATAALVLAAVCGAGFVAGAEATADDAQVYAEIDAAFDESFDLSEENGSWAEEL